MGQNVAVTEVIAALQSGDGSAFRALYEEFLDLARRAARHEISPEVQRRTSPTSIAVAALHDCLDEGKKGKYRDGKGLKGLLYLIIQRRAVDAVREATAQKRDVKRESYGDVVAARSANEIVAGLAVEIVQILLDVPDRTQGIIRVLGVLNEYSAGQIQEMIMPLQQNGKIPSIRAIQLAIAGAKLELEKRLGPLDDVS